MSMVGQTMGRWPRFLATSIVIHGILIIAYRAESPRDATPKVQPIKFRIIEKPKQAPAPASGSAITSRQAKPHALAQKPRPVTGAATGMPKTYGDLFPSVAEGVASTERADAARDAAAASFDPEGDAYSRETQLRSLARLDQFAAALGGQISIPDGLKKMSPSGSAYVRLTKTAEGWKVINVSGDPYYRALLFEVLASQPPQGYLFQLLDDTDYPTVRVFFSLVPVWVGDETAQPMIARTASNKVFLDFTHKYVDEKWQMAAAWNNPVGAGVLGVNFIGVGSYLWAKAHETDGSDDVDVKRLRLSPAFIRSIGR